MIRPGENYKLTFLRLVPDGLILGDENGESEEEILLPADEAPEDCQRGDELDVFVYSGKRGQKVATTRTPKLKLHDYGILQVVDVNDNGAFMDWGLDKDLMVPFSEQEERMSLGQMYLVYLDLDPHTDRLFATSKIESRLSNEELSVKEGDKVDLIVYRETDLGYAVVVNNRHMGLVFESDVYIAMPLGERVTGYVKKIRPDNKLDISIQPIGYVKASALNSDDLLQIIVDHGGFLPLTDKSAPDDIYDMVGISKKAFKRAVGNLYKNRKITLEKDGIRLNN